MDIVSLVGLVAAHWTDIAAALGGLWTFLSVINGFLKDTPFKTAFGTFLNFIAFLARQDAPGTFKKVFDHNAPSDPEAPASEKKGADVLKLKLIPILVLAAIGMAACSKCAVAPYKGTIECKALAAVTQCGPGAAAALLEALPLFIEGDIDAALALLEAKAPAEYDCIVAAIQNAADAKFGPDSPFSKALKSAVKARKAGKKHAEVILNGHFRSEWHLVLNDLGVQ